MSKVQKSSYLDKIYPITKAFSKDKVKILNLFYKNNVSVLLAKLKPSEHDSLNEIFFSVVSLLGVFLIMIETVTFLKDEFLLFGLIMGSIVIGLSFVLTKNIAFPVSILVTYNLIVGSMKGFLSIEYVFETVLMGIMEALFIVFVIVWTAIMIQWIKDNTYLRKTEKHTVWGKFTNIELIIGSIIAGTLHGLFMVIQIV